MGLVSYLEDILERRDDELLETRSDARRGTPLDLPRELPSEETELGLAYLRTRRQRLDSQRAEQEKQMREILERHARSPLIHMLFSNRDSSKPMSLMQQRKQQIREKLGNLKEEIEKVDNYIALLEQRKKALTEPGAH